MSKKEKNIEISENLKKVQGKEVIELTLKNKVLGTIAQENGKFIAQLPSEEEFRVNSKNEAMGILIREFHLHSSN
ncbi:DUF2969 domain-containing protein [Ligilactobacillus ceti]|uniref:DUF2969 domain-containing protein n=1 Tax=Ligilactobacillus ceti DSM 22408 TaxID=1122146 RepID=A0A0R2KNL7_9LACO|nr:DUF2969 domain-containing protein [Ligilactobacillus ceti]KRN88997.1 hypothetical protein IV53_GL000970 [Ligilactobacillus ceti DSM 22408]